MFEHLVLLIFNKTRLMNLIFIYCKQKSFYLIKSNNIILTMIYLLIISVGLWRGKKFRRDVYYIQEEKSVYYIQEKKS